MLSLKPSILAAILIGMVATQYLVAAEAGLVSAYSDISRVKCAASGKANGDDAPVTYRCKMLDELTLIAVYEGAVVRLSVLRNGEDTGLRLGAGYDVGKKLDSAIRPSPRFLATLPPISVTAAEAASR
jgi:hypothetical protein